MKILKSKSSVILTASILTLFALYGVGFGRGLFNSQDLELKPYKTSASAPGVMGAVHDVGDIGLSVTNQGNFGTGFIGSFIDPISGLAAPSCQYPYPSSLEYLFSGAFWIGAVVGRDTLVSVGADGWNYTREMWPDPPSGINNSPIGGFERHSISDPLDEKAVSEQDLICIYTDTLTNPGYVGSDAWDNRPHIPLNIEVTQRSYAWSYDYAKDFVLFDYSIKNISPRKTLNKVYMGVYVDADVGTAGNGEKHTDDICGFKTDVPSILTPPECNTCDWKDTIMIAYIADNDGKDKPTDMCPYTQGGSPTSVTGTRVVRTPSDSLKYSFNWWISNGEAPKDFGPRKVGTTDDPFRDFGGFLGTPEGDKNKYYIMRHEEFDYDQLYSAVDHSAGGWLPRSSSAGDFADGFDTRYLLSFGPFSIDPGEVLPITFAYIAGADFHTNCEAFKNIFNANDPDAYYNQLNFENFGRNSVWASWIYDNPGVDTDGDGNRGKYRLYIYDSIPDTTGTMTYLADTIWYEGDRVPDFVGAQPPPPPILRVLPRVTDHNEGELVARFNGKPSETTRDVFSQLLDFEGYKVYFALSKEQAQYTLITSYDKEDYDKYIWNNGKQEYGLKDQPFTIDSLRKLYGPDFNPLDYNRDNPFYWKDSAFIFGGQDWNNSGLLDTNFVHKRFPDQKFPTTLIVDSAKKCCPDELIEDSLFKYFDYEYTIKHLLPSQLYYVSVTAFDFGSPKGKLAAMESRQSANAVAEYPQNRTSIVESEGLKVIAYPNPYRIDGRYRSEAGGGFEGRGQTGATDDRVRRVHFMNLPHKCTIRIFTIDGDLVREIPHDFPIDSPTSSHDSWDLITRNTQAAVSGIYYWSVESESGNQVGKLVLIM